jgi:hypothetical protein
MSAHEKVIASLNNQYMWQDLNDFRKQIIHQGSWGKIPSLTAMLYLQMLKASPPLVGILKSICS